METEKKPAATCQSCGLPFNKEHAHFIGKENDGTDSIYCTICYKDGKFTDPEITMDQMIEIQLPVLVGRLGTEMEVRNMLQEFLPTLKRWNHS